MLAWSGARVPLVVRGSCVLGVGLIALVGIGSEASAVETDCARSVNPPRIGILAAAEERNRIDIGFDANPGAVHMHDNGVDGNGDPIDASETCKGVGFGLFVALRDRADSVNLDGVPSADDPFPVENIVLVRGGPGADRAYGHTGVDILAGGDGKNVLRGRGGDDFLRGGVGYDELGGGAGKDLLLGAGGSDVIHAKDRTRDQIRCGRGRFDVAVIDHHDRTRGCEREWLLRSPSLPAGAR
jgi:RTX calcium-binding nonapeptide repeat (4 copies)